MQFSGSKGKENPVALLKSIFKKLIKIQGYKR
jgi:hypothetical protein